MRRASLICCIFQSLSLSLFVITYNIQIACYLPIFWGVSNGVFASNFIRNRQYIASKHKNKIKWCNFCDICNLCQLSKIAESINNMTSPRISRNRNSGKSKNKPPMMDMVDHTSAGSLDDDDEEGEDEDDCDGMVILDVMEEAMNNDEDDDIPNLFHTSQNTATVTVNIENSDRDNDRMEMDEIQENEDNLSPLPKLPRLGDFHSNPVFSKSKPKLRVTNNINGYNYGNIDHQFLKLSSGKKDGPLSIKILSLKGTQH